MVWYSTRIATGIHPGKVLMLSYQACCALSSIKMIERLLSIEGSFRYRSGMTFELKPKICDRGLPSM